MNFKQKFIISIIGFVIVFLIFNYNSKTSDFFKSDSELFFEYYLPIKMENEKFIGEIADTSNHMYPYFKYKKTCLPKLEQWKNKIKSGDYISKRKGDLNLIVKDNNGRHELKFDKKSFKGSALPCE